MNKARIEIEKEMKHIDSIIEILDARLPLSSRNPMIDALGKDKPRILIFSKTDLADPTITTAWINYFEKVKNIPVITVAKEKRPPLSVLTEFHIKTFSARKWYAIRSVKSLVCGIPNVGKSTFLNSILGRHLTKVENRPGVTRSLQKVKISDRLELVDTPGLVWPKFEDQQGAVRLAIVGTIKDEVLNLPNIAVAAVEYMTHNYPKVLCERYKLESLSENYVETLDQIAKKRGCLISGKEVDYQKISALFLTELRKGLLGKISLENPLNLS